jgi:hypothetical protein
MAFGLIGILVLTANYFSINKISQENKMSANLDDDCLWSLGYGSNMDVKALEAKKHVKVLGKLRNLSITGSIFFQLVHVILY